MSPPPSRALRRVIPLCLSVSLSLFCVRARHVLTLHPYKPLEGEGEGHRRPEVGFPVEHGFEDAAHGFECRSVGERVSRVTPSALRHRRQRQANGIGLKNHFRLSDAIPLAVPFVPTASTCAVV